MLGNDKQMVRRKKRGKCTPSTDPRIDCIEQLLKKSSIFDNYFTDYARLTFIPKGKLLLKFTKSDIKFHMTHNPHHHFRNFISTMILKGIGNDIFHVIFPPIFDKDVIRWYNVVDPRKIMNWDDFVKEFLHQYSSDIDLQVTLRDFELIKQEKKDDYSDYIACWIAKAAHIMDRPSEADRMRWSLGTCSLHIGNIY